MSSQYGSRKSTPSQLFRKCQCGQQENDVLDPSLWNDVCCGQCGEQCGRCETTGCKCGKHNFSLRYDDFAGKYFCSSCYWKELSERLDRSEKYWVELVQEINEDESADEWAQLQTCHDTQAGIRHTRVGNGKVDVRYQYV